MFELMDKIRRAQGNTLGAFGLGPTECDYRILASGSPWRLRDYGPPHARSSLLMVPAPIKRPYIWDLAPSVSAVRYCLDRHLHVHLVEWMPPSHAGGNGGLDEYVDGISQCVARISGEAAGARPFLIGHSLGSTLATVFAALQPQSIRGLVLLSAPLCFQPTVSRFRDTIVDMAPSIVPEIDEVPGSLLSQLSALASPDTFIWSRLADAASSLGDRFAMDIHGRVERWALDEVPLPGRLVQQIFQWLYRENRLCRGTLRVRNTTVGPSRLRVPMLTGVNTGDEVAPVSSVKPFVEATPDGDTRVIEYPGEVGVGLQHLGILAGRQAYARIWPQIISWLNARS
jgi:polyhydroxyalkanoate synthase